MHNSCRSCGAVSMRGVTAQRDGAARLSSRLFALFDPVTLTLTFDLILIGGRGIVMDYPRCKFGDFNFSRFVLSCRGHRQTESRRRMIAILTRLPSPRVIRTSAHYNHCQFDKIGLLQLTKGSDKELSLDLRLHLKLLKIGTCRSSSW